jgi:hypothetical protein
MAKKKQSAKEPKHQFNDKVEAKLIGIFHDGEVQVSKQNKIQEMDDFYAVMDLFDAVRAEKDYDWMSDIFIPEFPSEMLTQTSIDVAQYFQTRDFVEVYVADETQEALDAAEATKELINRTLNRRELYHYLKYVRSKNLNHIKGSVVLKTWWEQEIKSNQSPAMDTDGEYITDDTGNMVMVGEEKVLKDQFNYDIVHPANVFMSTEYAYSLQQKEWVTLRYEKTLHQLKKEAPQFGYFNLDLVEAKMTAPQETDTSRETQDQGNPKQTSKNLVADPFDLYERYGKFWMMDGKPGIDEYGEVLDGAELVECVIGWLQSGSTKVLIQFHECPYKDVKENHYRPLIRGLCYVHPTDDNGVGDGKYSRELQVAINDAFNLGMDRTKLATIPTIQVRAGVQEDTDSIYFAPGHPMEVNTPGEDIKEFKIADDIAGAINTVGMLVNFEQQVSSIYPTTMGNMPGKASTTATAIAGAEQQTNKRMNYKSMTFEYTALCELYWQIQQMTWQFARPETGKDLMGGKVGNFSPNYDFWYKPLSQSVETDQSRAVKVERWMRVLQVMASTQHPDTVKAINYILMRIAELMGDEYVNFAVALLNPNIPIQQGQTPATGGQNALQPGMPTNQYGVPAGNTQAQARQTANVGGLLGA